MRRRLKRSSPQMLQVQTRVDEKVYQALLRYQKKLGFTASEAARDLLSKAVTILGVK